MMYSNEAVNTATGAGAGVGVTIPEDDVAQDPENPRGLRQRPTTLSEASKKFDVGGKGFLSGSERELRAYDTNSDGNLDVAELKKIVRELKDERKEKKLLKKISQGSAGVLLLSFLGNFGLIWAVLVLTRQLDTKGGDLTSTSTGEMVATKGKGNAFGITITPGSRRRLAGAKEKYGSSLSLRHLQATDLAISAMVPGCKRACMRTKYDDYTNGVSMTSTMVVDGTTIASTVGAGMTQTKGDGDGCDDYSNIYAVGWEAYKYSAKCCVATDCVVTFAGGRRL